MLYTRRQQEKRDFLKCRFKWVTQYTLKRCSNKECCKQCKYVKLKGIMTKWPVQKLTHRTTQKHVQYHDATRPQ